MKKLLMLAAVMLFVFSVSYAQESGSISGAVQVELNGTLVPLPRAHLAAFPENGERPAADSFTDSLGNYTLQVPFGAYHVKAEKMGLTPEWFDNVMHRDDATAVAVTAENSPTDINFILASNTPPQEMGLIDGRITESGTDHGIAMARIIAVRISGDPLTLETHSTWNGSYAFYRVPQGEFIVTAQKEGYNSASYPDTLFVDSNTFHDIDIALEPLPPPVQGTISGIVLGHQDDGDYPLRHSTIFAYPLDGNHVAGMAVADSLGHYTLEVVVGNYQIQAVAWEFLPMWYDNVERRSEATIVTVSDSVSPTGINFLLNPVIPPEETGISGTVTDAATNEPISGAWVTANNVDNHRQHFWGRTDDSGAYFINARAGEYSVEAAAPGYWPLESPENVTVAENEVTDGVDFALSAINFGSIAGMVTDSTGTPIPRAFVEARRMGGNCARHIRTDSSGAYLLDNLIPGVYRVTAFHWEFGPGVYPDSITVADGQHVTGIDIVLGASIPPLDGNISGTVTDDSTGAPIANAMVMIVGRHEVWGRHSWIFRRAFTDSTGNYAFDNLPAVPLKLFAGARGYFGEFYDNVRRFSEATPVTPDAENVNFALTAFNHRTRSIAGRIIMPEGYETDGLFAYASLDGEIVDVIAADPMGYYNIDNLEAETYDISVSSVYGDINVEQPVEVIYSDAREDIEFHVTAVDDNDRQLPKATSLAQNYPNPFNARTVISFNLAQTGNVELSVYNVVGQKVTTLISGNYGAGDYSVTWDGKDSSGKIVSSGIYYYRLSANGLTATMKMTMLK